jgi:predicted metal-dependent hydrolase
MPGSKTVSALAPVPGLVDQIVRSKRKTIAIIVQRDGSVLVRAPLRAAERTIRAFIESKSAWINEKKLLAQQQGIARVKKFAEGEKFLLLGKEIPLRLARGQKAALVLQEAVFCLSAQAAPDALAVFEHWYKAQAREVLTRRAQFFAAQHGFRYEKVRITSARTRWGSCSSRGSLSFTWRLVMAPLEVVDYVVIHELAHLKIKNHSVVFWAEVARLMPDYKRHRDWLKKNGHSLTLGGEA